MAMNSPFQPSSLSRARLAPPPAAASPLVFLVFVPHGTWPSSIQDAIALGSAMALGLVMQHLLLVHVL